MTLPSETIAVPVTKGIDVNTEARLVQPPALLEAINSRFVKAGGATKRRGHVSSPVRGNTPQPPGSVATHGAGWLFGFGYVAANQRLLGTNYTDTTVTPDYPETSLLCGLASRDTESLAWNGHLLYSQGSSGPQQVKSDAIMPTLVAAPIAKVQTSQLYPDFADTGVIKVVTWIDEANRGYYAVYDSTTLAPLVLPKLLSAAGASYTTAYLIRVVAVGSYVHICLADSGNSNLVLLSIDGRAPTANLVQRSLGPCLSYMDVWKIDETEFIVVRNNLPYIDISWVKSDGSPSTAHVSMSVLPDLSSWISGARVGVISCAYQPTAGLVSLAYTAVGVVPTGFPPVLVTKAAVWVTSVVDTTGSISATNIVSSLLDTSVTTVGRVTVTPKFFPGPSAGMSDVFWEEIDASQVPKLNRQRVDLQSGVQGSPVFKYHQWIASRAFTVGNRALVWTGHSTALQSTWFLLDEGLGPIGHMDFGVANSPVFTSRPFTASVCFAGRGITNLTAAANGVVTPAVTSFQLCLGFKVRVPATSSTSGVFTEPSIKAVTLNFLPKLRSAQAGRCTYFAGAQLWSYDGAELAEAGFHIGPELETPVASVGGTLANPGSYSYRVDLCYRNAQNEEVRSLSILTPSVATTAANKTITLRIPSCITRRANSYVLIYRNAVVAGVPLTNWWLLNSRDPASTSFYANDQTVAYRTVVDDGSVTDTAIQNFELHPATSGDTYLQPVAAPACELVSSGHDRIWVAGGELASGVVAPSRLFSPGEAPTFNPYLNVQVDRGFEPITAVGFVGNIKVFFRKNNAYILDGDGPDNVSNGLWGTPQLALADIGATSQDSLALITQGLFFQSDAGIRLMSPSGNVAPVGIPLDPVARVAAVRGAIVANHDQEVRWYCEDQVIVYNYLHDAWSTWTFGAVGVIRLSSGRAAVARPDGNLWVETDGVWVDGILPYTHRIRFPWLHGGNLGDFQRVRSIQGLGRFADSLPHNVHVDLYYDEREFVEESFDWVMPDTTSSNVDTWGASTWGAGVWGDTHAVVNNMSDSTWEWVRMPNRQKCSVFSVAIDDNSTAGAGFVLTALGLELAKKEGLNRTPERGGTNSGRGGQ